jgi:hypothetical protein
MLASNLDAVKIANGTVSSAEYQYLDGLTSSIQTQLDNIFTWGTTALAGKADVSGETFTGAIAAPNLSGTNTGDITLAAIGSTPNANGASLSGQILNLQPASSTFGGVITIGAQTLSGAKTWSNLGTFNAGILVTGGIVNLNNDATANGVNIGTSTNTGTIKIGGTGAQTIQIGSDAGIKNVNLGSSNSSSSTIIEAGSGGLNIGTSAIAKSINLGTDASVSNSIDIGGASSTTIIGSVRNTIGIAGAAKGDGIRFGNARMTINKPGTPSINLDAAYNPTVTEILETGIFGFNTSANRTFTIPTASGVNGLVQALPGTPAVGDVFTFVIYNTSIGTSAVVLAGAAGVTIVNNNTIRNDRTDTRIVICRVTSVVANAETISVY